MPASTALIFPGTLYLKKNWYAFLFILLFLQAKPQHKKDSLLAIWNDSSKPDTLRTNALDKFCGMYYSIMPDSVIAYSQQEYDFAKKRNLIKSMAQSLMTRATTYYLKGDVTKCLYYNRETLKLNIQMHYEKGIGKCYLNIGSCYMHWNDGVKALDYFYRALKIFTKTKEQECLAITFSNLSDIYRQTGQTDSAIALIKKSLAIHTRMKNKARIISALNRMGTIYYSGYKPTEAIVYHQKAVALGSETENPRQLAESYNHLARDYVELKQFDLAKDFAFKSLEISKRHKDSLFISQALLVLSNAVHDMGELDKAVSLGEEAMTILKAQNMMPLQVNLAVTMAMWYSEQKNLKKADEMYEFYFKNRGVTNKDRIKEELFRSQVKYDFEKQQLIAKAAVEKQLAVMRAESERKVFQKNLLLTASVALLFILLLSAYFVYHNFRQKNIIADQKNNLLKQQLLVSQMNPHFIFNSLNAVQNFIFKQDSYQAGVYLKQFSGLIRMILDFSRKDMITLDQEINFLENYLELQKLRFDNKLNYRITVDALLDPEAVMIPPMLAQPFIENAIEHGIFYKDGEGVLSIKISLRKNTLVYEIEDNGIGIEESQRLKSNGTPHRSLAIKIAKERIEAMNLQNKTNFEIEIKDKQLFENESTGVYVKFATPYLTV